MNIDTKTLVEMSEANQNFSKAARVVDQEGVAVIMKNSKPKYVVLGFEEYEEVKTAIQLRKKKIEDAADELLAENLEALMELAK